MLDDFFCPICTEEFLKKDRSNQVRRVNEGENTEPMLKTNTDCLNTSDNVNNIENVIDQTTQESDDDGRDCDLILVMPCDPKHAFHPACATKWLSRSSLCPLCKQDVFI